MPSTDHVIELFSSQKGRHPPLSLSLPPSLSRLHLLCLCLFLVCKAIGLPQVANLPSCKFCQPTRCCLIHSFADRLCLPTVRPFVHLSVCLSARLLWPGWLRFVYFYPKNYLAAAAADDDDFLLQFCICVSRELGIQFLFITHSAAKLFLNCPYQLRNEIYYLACVYRQFASHTRHHQAPSLPRDFDNDDDDDGRQLRQADNVLNFCCRIIISLVGSSSSSSSLPSHSMPSKRIPCHSIASSTTAHPLSSSTSLVLCAAPTTFCIFT